MQQDMSQSSSLEDVNFLRKKNRLKVTIGINQHDQNVDRGLNFLMDASTPQAQSS